MSFVTLNAKKLQHNYHHLNTLFRTHDIEWAIVAKVLCGNETFLREVIKLGTKEICDSRISNLKAIKKIDPQVQTVYIKPPAKRMIQNVIRYADVSFNTEYDTILALSNEAAQQHKTHKIVIMIEMGELREGVMREEFLDFYEKVFGLPNIRIVGIGTNLTCMYGVLPNHDKLIQLCLYKQLVEAKFQKKIPYISGGASVTIPLIDKHLLPHGVNHFRIGETLFLGTDVYHNCTFENMHNDVFKLYAEIIELNEKPKVPIGELGHNLSGDQLNFDQNNPGEKGYRAIVDIGLLDIEPSHLQPVSENVSIVGASSDMLVLDVKDNPEHLKVGDLVAFKMDYMGLLRVMNSSYVDKIIEENLHVEEQKHTAKAWIN